MGYSLTVRAQDHENSVLWAPGSVAWLLGRTASPPWRFRVLNQPPARCPGALPLLPRVPTLL